MKKGIFLLLGTNLGDRFENLKKAKDHISNEVGNILQESSVYKTAPWGDVQQPDFFNQVIEVQTTLLPEALLEKTLHIEKQMGRIRDQKWGPRTIDIDILFYDEKVVASSSLIIPHQSLHLRRFTLVPLVEIAGEFKHPILEKNLKLLLEECPDKLPVEKIE
jgi:2-amino-4-hydroxy-6-hydroxymethyldihydropteridine diphosphokinase